MNSRSPRRMPRLLLLVFVATLLLPAAALAAPVSLEDTEIFVQLWPEGEPGTNIVIVGVLLPQTTKLPATVRLPLPDGAEVFWVGEVMGSDPADDIQREYTIVDVGGGKAVEFTTETTLSVQIDATYGSIVIDGNDLISEFDYRQTVKSASTSFAVLTPPSTGDVTTKPAFVGEPDQNSLGERLYTLPGAVLDVGETHRVEVSYRRAGVEAASGDSGTTVILVLAALLVVAVIALAAAIVTQKRRAPDA